MIIRIYALAVCFVAVIVLFVNIGTLAYGVIGVMNPKLTIENYTYNKFQNNDLFWDYHTGNQWIKVNNNDLQYTRPNEKILTNKRMSGYKIALDNEIRSNIQNMLTYSLSIFLSFSLILIHWFFILRKKTDKLL